MMTTHVLVRVPVATDTHRMFYVRAELVVPFPSRQAHELYAAINGFFWLPCPQCGQHFGGHEQPQGSVRIEGQPNASRSTCPDCAPTTGGGRVNERWTNTTRRTGGRYEAWSPDAPPDYDQPRIGRVTLAPMPPLNLPAKRRPFWRRWLP
jgi:hypothetical protein